MKSWLLISIIRYICKTLVLLCVSSFSPQNNIYLFFILFLAGVTEMFFSSRFSKNYEILWLYITTSLVTLIPTLFTNILLFLLFSVIDVFVLLSIGYWAFVIGAMLTSFSFFIASFSSYIILRDVIDKKGLIPPHRNSVMIDMVKVGGGGIGAKNIGATRTQNIQFSKGVFSAGVQIGEGDFLVIVKTIEGYREVIFMVFPASAIPLFFFFVQMLSKRIRAQGKDHEAVDRTKEDVWSPTVGGEVEHPEDMKGTLSYFLKGISSLEDAVKKDKLKLKAVGDEIESFERNLSEKLLRIDKITREMKELISNMDKEFSEKLSLEDFHNRITELKNLMLKAQNFISGISIDLSLLKDGFATYERNLLKNFREFEHLFHEIFSPLGGLENEYGKMSQSLYLHKGPNILLGTKEKIPSLLSTLQGFTGDMKEIIESIDVIYLNSQVIAHKIRDKLLSFGVLTSAVAIILDRINEILSSVKQNVKKLDEIYEKIQNITLEEIEENGLKKLDDLISTAKSTVENMVVGVNSVISSQRETIRESQTKISEFLILLDSFMKITSHILRDIEFPISYLFDISRISFSNIYAFAEKDLKKFHEKLEENLPHNHREKVGIDQKKKGRT